MVGDLDQPASAGGVYVEENSGMARAVPAWKIKEILDGDPVLVEVRAERERAWQEIGAGRG